MKLEVGKSYIDRDGNVWNVVETNISSVLYPFRATNRLGNLEWFTEGGSYYLTQDSGYDFVSEVKNEPTKEPEKMPAVKLEVGKSYIDRDGNVWHVVGYNCDFPYQYNAKADGGFLHFGMVY